MSYSVVWFKRDLRVHDHAALHQAAARGPVLCLYVLEPSLWAEPDAATLPPTRLLAHLAASGLGVALFKLRQCMVHTNELVLSTQRSVCPNNAKHFVVNTK